MQVVAGIESVWTDARMHRLKETLQISDDALKIIRQLLTQERDPETGRWSLCDVPGLEEFGLGEIAFPSLPSRYKIQKLRVDLRKQLGLKFTEDGLLATIDPEADAIKRLGEFVKKGLLKPGMVVRCALLSVRCESPPPTARVHRRAQVQDRRRRVRDVGWLQDGRRLHALRRS